MDPRDLRTNAEDYHVEMLEQGDSDEWAVSVWAAEMGADEIALACPIRHSQIRVSTVGEIRGLGHDVVSSVGGLHADLKLARKPDDEDWAALCAVFSEPRPNPRLEVADA